MTAALPKFPHPHHDLRGRVKQHFTKRAEENPLPPSASKPFRYFEIIIHTKVRISACTVRPFCLECTFVLSREYIIQATGVSERFVIKFPGSLISFRSELCSKVIPCKLFRYFYHSPIGSRGLQMGAA